VITSNAYLSPGEKLIWELEWDYYEIWSAYATNTSELRHLIAEVVAYWIVQHILDFICALGLLIVLFYLVSKQAQVDLGCKRSAAESEDQEPLSQGFGEGTSIRNSGHSSVSYR